MKERSVFTTFMIPLLILVTAEALLFAGVLFASGLLPRLLSDERTRFDYQTELRAGSLKALLQEDDDDALLNEAEADAILPYDELSFGEDACYAVVVPDPGRESASGTTAIRARILLSDSAHRAFLPAGETILLRAGEDGSLFFVGNGTEYAVTLSSVGNDKETTEERMLAAFVRTEALNAYPLRIARVITLSALLMIGAGIAGSFLIGKRLSRSIRQLSDEVERAQRDKLEVPKLSMTGIREIDHFAGAITAMSRDMNEQRALEKKRIEHERDFDLLTGLMNQASFVRNCARIFATPDFLGNAAVLMLDLDNVKEVNDTYGHEKGDAYIRLAAKVFSESAPAATLIAKVAGDEFYMFYYGFSSRKELDAQIERLRRAIASSSVEAPGGTKIPLRVTGGIARYPEDGVNHTELMKFAEFEAYQLKQRSKGKIMSFNRREYARSASEVRRRQDLKELLKDSSKVSFRYQPIFDAVTGQVHAYESLMRADLEHLHYPSDILELARREKRLMDVERITWNRGLESYRTLLQQGLVEKDAVVLLNSVSSLCLPQEELEVIGEQNADILDRIVIEITESEHMDEGATLQKRSIPHFSGMFALDDYGSGYNSEKTLLELSPKYIKVDLSIIRDIDSSPDKQRIVSNIVRYAHEREREMYIIAEGIETPSELQTVCDLGVDLLQGFYLAREGRVPPPLSVEASEFLDRRQLEAV